MKKSFFTIIGLMFLSVSLAGCGKGFDGILGKTDDSSEINESDANEPKEKNAGEVTNYEKEADNGEVYFSFETFVCDTDSMIAEAVAQYNEEDYTPLDEPVEYYVLWLGFTHVTYDDLDFRMTDFDREYLEAVALNFEKSVESMTNNNLDITVDLYFVDEEATLTRADGDDWLYLSQDTAQPYIDEYTENAYYDTVLTTVQTAGEENRKRNESKSGYGLNYVMLGLETADLSTPMGYSTFDLTEPREGTYPLEDPEIPSLYATAVAVHEWMHQLEYIGTILGIEYPNTHAYHGPDEFPGYREYIADENDYDYFEFYRLVLSGKLPYDDGVTVKYVGMYPKMWPLIKRNIYNLGEYTIQVPDGVGYLAGFESEPTLTLSEDPCVWNIRYSGNGRFILSPAYISDKLIDLSNAWDIEGNTIGLWVYTGYVDAQSWLLKENSDGTYSISTPYESGRVITASFGAQATLCSPGANGIQEWIISPE